MQRLLLQFPVDIEHIEHNSCCFETFLIVSPIIVAWMSGVERSGVERVKLEEELQRIA